MSAATKAPAEIAASLTPVQARWLCDPSDQKRADFTPRATLRALKRRGLVESDSLATLFSVRAERVSLTDLGREVAAVLRGGSEQ